MSTNRTSSNYFNLTASQFATFRSDVRHAAHNAAKGEFLEHLPGFENRINELVTKRTKDLESKLHAQILINKSQDKLLTDLVARIEKLEGPDSVTKTPNGETVYSSKSRPENGDTCKVNGEQFIYWWGQWRRPSELEGFATWMARRATAPTPTL